MAFKILNLDSNSYDYQVIVQHEHKDGRKYTLIRSNNGEWSEDYKNTEALSLINTGNGIIFPKKIYTGEADYTSTAELLILLNFINKMEDLPIYNGKIEETSLIQEYTI